VIDHELRKAIWILNQKDVGINDLAKKFGLDRKTIHGIVDLRGEMPQTVKINKKQINEDLLRKVYERCQGMTPRVHEILIKEHQLNIGYSTLTALIRELGIGKAEEERSCQVPDKPGDEFQHDTSPYVLLIGEHKIKIQGSSLYWRYSKVRCLQFYPSFTKFHLKCFFHEGLARWKYVAETCIVDNTNLVVHHGTGANAVFHQDMNAFCKQYGFKWKAHAIKHSDRKGGVEKSLHFVETNFFPGRIFNSLEDLNVQAKEWCESVAKRPHSRTKLIPLELLEIEKPHLIPVEGAPRPYLIHERIIDQYGFISFNGNYFWAPKGHEGKVDVLEYSDKLTIYQRRKELITYPLPPWGSRGRKMLPEGIDLQYKPKKSTVDTTTEENALKSLGENYKNHFKNAHQHLNRAQYYQLIRGLYSFYRKEDRGLFDRVMDRCIRYRVYELQTILNIKNIILSDDSCGQLDIDFGENFGPVNITEGEFGDEVDLSRYDYQGPEE